MKHLLLIWTLIIAAGCAAAPDVVGDFDEERLPAGIWDVEAGELIEEEQLIDRLQEARFVIVGESHGTAWHHEVQTTIYEGLSDRRSGEVALGLEMVEWRFQEELDAYAAGEIDEESMLAAVGWEKRWGVDAELYAPMWRRARRESQPVIGLNARRQLVSKVGEFGLDGVPEEMRQELPDIDRSNDEYREHLRHIFAAHGAEMDEDSLNRFFEAQLVWDETMAEQAWEFLTGPRGVEQMVILTGRGHVERGYGIPSRLERRGADSEDVVSVIAVSTDGDRGAAMEEYRNLEFLRGEEIADYVWIE